MVGTFTSLNQHGIGLDVPTHQHRLGEKGTTHAQARRFHRLGATTLRDRTSGHHVARYHAAVCLARRNPHAADVAYELPPSPLGGFPVLVIGGRDDTTVKPELARKTPEFLTANGAAVDFRWAAGTHHLTDDDERFSATWLKKIAPEAPSIP